MARQPGDEMRDIWVVAGARQLPLPRPARDLACEVIAGLAVIGEPDRAWIDIVQSRQRAREGAVHLPALVRRNARQGAIVEHAAIDPLHEVEERADDVAV